MKELTPNASTGERWLGLWNEARAGDRQAEAQILKEVRPFLRAAVAKRLRGQAFGPWDGSDVVQKLSVKLLLSDHDLQGTTGQEFLAWLQTMVRNEILDFLRAGKAQKRGGGQSIVSLTEDAEGATDTSTPSRQLMRQEDQQQLQDALGRLSEDDRQVIGLRISAQKFTWAQIAEQMNRSEDAIKQLFRRAFKRLQNELKGDS